MSNIIYETVIFVCQTKGCLNIYPEYTNFHGSDIKLYS